MQARFNISEKYVNAFSLAKLFDPSSNRQITLGWEIALFPETAFTEQDPPGTTNQWRVSIDQQLAPRMRYKKETHKHGYRNRTVLNQRNSKIQTSSNQHIQVPP